jgi:hypothetical protein
MSALYPYVPLVSEHVVLKNHVDVKDESKWVIFVAV